jgi:hypothetical protein
LGACVRWTSPVGWRASAGDLAVGGQWASRLRSASPVQCAGNGRFCCEIGRVAGGVKCGQGAPRCRRRYPNQIAAQSIAEDQMKDEFRMREEAQRTTVGFFCCRPGVGRDRADKLLLQRRKQARKRRRGLTSTTRLRCYRTPCKPPSLPPRRYVQVPPAGVMFNIAVQCAEGWFPPYPRLNRPTVSMLQNSARISLPSTRTAATWSGGVGRGLDWDTWRVDLIVRFDAPWS